MVYSYLVTIKSGPNWGNSGQIREMKLILQKGCSASSARAAAASMLLQINGCCYGKDDSPEKDEYMKLCGQRFWTFLSGSDSLYTDIIEPLGHHAREKKRGVPTKLRTNHQPLHTRVLGEILTKTDKSIGKKSCVSIQRRAYRKRRNKDPCASTPVPGCYLLYSRRGKCLQVVYPHQVTLLWLYEIPFRAHCTSFKVAGFGC